METVTLYNRVTDRYRDGWYHLDDWEPVAQVKMTAPRLVREGNDYDDGGTYVRYFRRPAGIDQRKIYAAVRDTLSGSHCRHEYDCCGCVFTSVRSSAVNHRTVRVEITVNRNF